MINATAECIFSVKIFCTLTWNIFLIMLMQYCYPVMNENGKWMLFFFPLYQPDLIWSNLTNPIKEYKEYKPFKISVDRVIFLLCWYKSHTSEFVQIIHVNRIWLKVLPYHHSFSPIRHQALHSSLMDCWPCKFLQSLSQTQESLQNKC